MTAPISHWVFGYGSLMWRPGFRYVQTKPAKIFGYSRSLCVYSFHYRGSDTQPGLVLGLERGGSCHGMGFEVAAEDWLETVRYLRDREQVTMVYREVQTVLRFSDTTTPVTALTYVADPNHDQYAGKLPREEILALVQTGKGLSGTCQEYVQNTLAHLRQINIYDPKLEAINRDLRD